MSLEPVDIKEVLHDVAEGKLVHIKQIPVPINEPPIDLYFAVFETERKNGDVSIWNKASLFRIEAALSLPENKELRVRWNTAIKLNTKIRMNLLRCKALDMLEHYQNKSETSSAPDIAYCKTLLADVLTEGMAAARAKYYNRTSGDSSGLESDDIDEMANLREQL